LRRVSPPRIVRRAAVLTVAAAVLAAGALGVLWATLPDPAPLVRQNPRTTALIEQRRAEAKERGRAFRPRQAWVGLENVSPRLVQAVLLSEDANFFGHAGLDWEAIRDAAGHDLRAGRFARGASTLTQQLAKNLWLGTEKSLWRKAKEAVLAAKLERVATKKRILALYLNVVELDEGVFGVEAGARHRFGASAATLSVAQAVVLASMLPAPRRVDLSRPSSWLVKRSRRLLDRMREVGRISADEHLRASAELERILAGPAPADDREEPPDDDAPAAARARAAGTGVAAAEPPAATETAATPASDAAAPSGVAAPTVTFTGAPAEAEGATPAAVRP
jgi:monofunctional biosynthetic peptidoglycan transglycosylase